MDCKEIKPVLKEINPEYSLEGLMLKLKLQFFGRNLNAGQEATVRTGHGTADWFQIGKGVLF